MSRVGLMVQAAQQAGVLMVLLSAGPPFCALLASLAPKLVTWIIFFTIYQIAEFKFFASII